MSRLATMVGALSAIVSLVDYLVARSFLSHWLQRQINHGADGWRITPTLNLLVVVGLVGLVWLATESNATDSEARRRLFRLRANLVLGGLTGWFLLGPSIGDTELAGPSPSGAAHLAGPAPAVSGPESGPRSGGAGASLPATPGFQGHTSQYTWRPAAQPPSGTWKPGDGLRAMARTLEDASAPTHPPAR